MLKFWDKKETLFWPNGEDATPADVIKAYPFAKNFPTVLEQSAGITVAIDSLPMLVTVYQIDEALSDDEKLAEVVRIRNEMQNPPPAPPSAEERIAAALEFQAMLALPDEK